MVPLPLADRAGRLEVVERQGQELGQIPILLNDIDHLKRQMAKWEADRATRLEAIEQQGRELHRIPELEKVVEELRERLVKAKDALVRVERDLIRLTQRSEQLHERIQTLEHGIVHIDSILKSVLPFS